MPVLLAHRQGALAAAIQLWQPSPPQVVVGVVDSVRMTSRDSRAEAAAADRATSMSPVAVREVVAPLIRVLLAGPVRMSPVLMAWEAEVAVLVP